MDQNFLPQEKNHEIQIPRISLKNQGKPQKNRHTDLVVQNHGKPTILGNTRSSNGSNGMLFVAQIDPGAENIDAKLLGRSSFQDCI